MKTIWTVHAATTAVLLLASPAFADLTLEYREKSVLNGGAGGWTKCEVRSDRSRTQRGFGTFHGQDDAPSEVTIVRADRHVFWQLHPDERTYYEFPWPDTANEYPPVFPSQIEADAYEQAGQTSVLDSLRKAPPRPTKLIRTGKIETIRGAKVEHVQVLGLGRNPDPPYESNDAVDLWLTVDYPHTVEIKRLIAVLAQHRDWWVPKVIPAEEGEVNGLIRSRFDSFAGIPIRIQQSFQVDASYQAQLQSMIQCLSRGTGNYRDSQTGAFIESVVDLETMTLGQVPDSTFEIPAGYRKVDVTSWAKARREFLSKSHSPR